MAKPRKTSSTGAALREWLLRLEQLHPEKIELGLARVGAVYRALGSPRPARQVITVGGTNGKGSVVRILQALLAADASPAQRRTGIYTSPHLRRFNERIVIDGSEVSDAALCDAFERVERARLASASSNAGPVTLTYFEFTTLAALSLFAQASLDFAILEVGLGGRLDAVNIVDADIAVITSIDLDHEHWLGNSRETIAREKAGILRPGIRCVIGEPDVPASLVKVIGQLAAKAWWAVPDIPAGEDRARERRTHGIRQSSGALCWEGCDSSGNPVTLQALPQPALAAQNWSTALQVALLAQVLPGERAVAALMKTLALRGRGSIHALQGRDVLLDVAHNPAAIARLAELLARRKLDKPGPVWMVFAALADKRIDEMLRSLIPCIDHWIFPQLRNCPRGLDADKMLQNFHAARGEASAAGTAGSVAQALLRAVSQAPADALVCVCGSFYTVGEALELIDDEPGIHEPTRAE